MEKKKLILLVTISAIIFLSCFLRFFRLRDYIIFLGDQGRDVLVIKKMLIDGKMTLLGPVASVGGFYLGPIYYYFISPFLLLFKYDPIGPAVFIALTGVFTTWFVYFFAKKNFSSWVALLAEFFYAVSPILVRYNRFSWNPNLVPFFSILLLATVVEATEKQNWKKSLEIGIILGILFQLHYLAFIFAPTIAVLLILANGKNWLISVKQGVGIIFGLIIGWLPFILYEIRHQLQNFKGLLEFITRRDGANVGYDSTRYAKTILDNFNLTFAYLFNLPLVLSYTIGILVLLLLIKTLFSQEKRMRIISGYILISYLILSLYKGKMGEHYFNILYVPVLIFFSREIVIFARSLKLGKVLMGILLVILTSFSVKNYPFWQQPNKQLDQTIEVSRYIFDHKTNAQPFNFALITKTNSDHAYRYFFDLWGNEPLEIKNEVLDPKRETVTDNLIVLCEPLSPCTDPRGHSLWEIAAFGRAEIVDKEAYGVYTIYRLKHYKI